MAVSLGEVLHSWRWIRGQVGCYLLVGEYFALDSSLLGQVDRVGNQWTWTVFQFWRDSESDPKRACKIHEEGDQCLTKKAAQQRVERSIHRELTRQPTFTERQNEIDNARKRGDPPPDFRRW